MEIQVQFKVLLNEFQNNLLNYSEGKHFFIILQAKEWMKWNLQKLRVIAKILFQNTNNMKDLIMII